RAAWRSRRTASIPSRARAGSEPPSRCAAPFAARCVCRRRPIAIASAPRRSTENRHEQRRSTMKIAILLYEGFTALDCIGPYEVLSRLPGADLAFVAARAGVVTSDTGFLKLTATRGIAEVDAADLVLVPGGPGDEAVRADAPTLDWLRRMHERTTW